MRNGKKTAIKIRKCKGSGRHGPNTQTDLPRPIALTGDRGETFLVRGQALIAPHEQQRHKQNNCSQGRRQSVIGQPHFRVGRPINRRAEDANARGETKQAGNVEGFDHDDNIINQLGEQRRPHDRQGHAHGGLGNAASGHGALFFQRRVHGAKGSRDHEIGRRHQPQPLHETHAVKRIDIEGADVRRQTENAAQHNIDEPDAWIKQLNPGDRRKQRRNCHRHEDQCGEPGAPRNRRALQNQAIKSPAASRPPTTPR